MDGMTAEGISIHTVPKDSDRNRSLIYQRKRISIHTVPKDSDNKPD